MHPDIVDVLSLYREVFSDSEIDLCTNGLLIPKMTEKFWQCLVDNRITVHISGYKPTYHILDKLADALEGHGVNYTILRRDSFYKYYTPDKMEIAFITLITALLQVVGNSIMGGS